MRGVRLIGRAPVERARRYLKGFDLSMLSGLMLAKLTAPALVMALSPVPIVVSLVLLVHNDRPYASSVAYFLGRLVSLVVLTTALMHVPRLFDALAGSAPAWVDWLVTSGGVVLVALGVLVWWRRARAVGQPGWGNRAGGMTPVVAASLGMFPMLANPKVLAASAAVGMEIASGHFTAASAVLGVVYFAIVANSTVAAPILAYFIAGPRIERRLERLRHWIHDRHQALIALTLAIAGIAVVLYGLA